MVTFNSAHQAKKKESTFQWFKRQQRGVRIDSSKFSEPKRYFCRLKIIERKYIQEKQPN